MRIIAWSSDVCSSDLGYLGDPSLGAVILDTFSRIRAANPQALWTCDPVMGNKGKGLFVRAGVPGFMAEGALPAADILTPNLFELELLTGLKPRGLQAVRAEICSASWRERGVRYVSISGVRGSLK